MQLATRPGSLLGASQRPVNVASATARPRSARRSLQCKVVAGMIDPGVMNPGGPGMSPGVPGPSIIPPGTQPGGGDPVPGNVPDIDPGTAPSPTPPNYPGGGVPDPGVSPGIDPGGPGGGPSGAPGIDPGVISPGDSNRMP